MPGITPSEAALLHEIRQLRARIASLEAEQQVPKEIVEKAPVMISIVRAPDFVYELVNPAFQALAPGKEFLGCRFSDVWAEVPDPLVEILQNVIATGQTFHLEEAPYTIQRGRGMPPEVVYVSYSWIALLGPDGKPDRVLTLAHEVTGAVRQRQQIAESEEAFRKSEEQFRVLTENLQSAVALIDEHGAFSIVNSSFRRIFDIPPDADILNINSRDWSEWQVFGEDGLLLDVDDHPVRRAALSGTPVKNQLVAVKSPSSPDLKWLLTSAEPILDAQGKIHRLICTYYDITERKRAEEARRESEERFRVVQELSPDGFLIFRPLRDDTGTVTDFLWVYENDAAARMNDTDPNEVFGKRVSEVLPHHDESPFHKAYKEVAETGEVRVVEEASYDQDTFRQRRWFRVVAVPTTAGDVAILVQNVTERKRTEEQLRQSLEHLERVLDNETVGVMFWDLNTGVMVDANNTFLKLMGYSRADVESRTLFWQKLTPPEYMDVSRAEIEKFLVTGRVGPYEKEYFQKDGTRRWLLFAGSSLGDNQCVEFCVDISERKRAEAALRESETRERARAAELAGILDAAPVALFIASDPECRDMIGSRLTYETLHLPIGANFSKSASEDRPSTFRVMRAGREIPPEELPAQKAASTGQAVRNCEFDVVYEDGSSRNMLGSAVPLFDESGKPRGAVGAFVDITENKRNEERLRQAQKLESIGLLAGGIAHDFNNLLTGVMGNTSLLLEDASPEQAETLRSVIASTERAAHLTRQLLAYSGKGQFIVRELDVTQAVSEMADLVQFSIPKSVGLSLNLDRRLPPVAMDPGQLQQILMNLVINAGEAIGEGKPGRITVTTSMADVESPFTDELGEEIPPGRYVRVEVHDTGSGIDPEKKAKIFEPFFTTKFIGRGLGLAAIAGILRSQKGGIVVESEPGKGSTFRVFLPSAGRTGVLLQEPGLRDGRPVVLVIDDEVAVREFISAVLRRKGYPVLEASDGQEALAACASAPGAIGAAIVDIVMPEMSANDLLPALKARQPGMRILLTSGYSEAEARRLCAAYPSAAFIQKPYTAQQLAILIDELVGADRST